MTTHREWEVWDRHTTNEYISKYGMPQRARGGHQHRMRDAAKLLEGESVLDAGCGMGHLYPYIRERISTYLGVDNSLEMLAQARKAFPDARFEQGDIYDLSPFGVFDTVYCLSVLIHLPEIGEPIRELWKHVDRALVFSIPLEKKKVIKKRPYKDRYLIYHGEPWENIAKVVEELENVGIVEQHAGQTGTASNLYVKVYKNEGL